MGGMIVCVTMQRVCEMRDCTSVDASLRRVISRTNSLSLANKDFVNVCEFVGRGAGLSLPSDFAKDPVIHQLFRRSSKRIEARLLRLKRGAWTPFFFSCDILTGLGGLTLRYGEI